MDIIILFIFTITLLSYIIHYHKSMLHKYHIGKVLTHREINPYIVAETKNYYHIEIDSILLVFTATVDKKTLRVVSNNLYH